MFQSLLELDSSISIFFRGLVAPESPFVPVVRFFSDGPVFLVGVLLVGLWLW
jgi:hypothetical protein